jgi:hypothetical protein
MKLPDDVEFHQPMPEAEGVDYYSYCPADSHADTPVLVCVHGITRNSQELLEAFLPFAKQQGFMLLVPHFSPELFPDYQRLGVRGSGQRADQALQSILLQVKRNALSEYCPWLRNMAPPWLQYATTIRAFRMISMCVLRSPK